MQCLQDGGAATYNDTAIDLVLQLVKFKRATCPRDEIMVVSFYKEQVFRIKSRFQKEKMGKDKFITVSTVDACQGGAVQIVPRFTPD